MSGRIETQDSPVVLNRRSFLAVAGAGLAGLTLAAGCAEENTNQPTGSTTFDVGSGDTGILNYAYALEQLEAEFYNRVLAAGSGSGLSQAELTVFGDIRDHEVAHREFFKAALAGNALPTLSASQFNFSKINFGNRNSILQAAMAFEDLGVQAYNGAGRFLTNVNNLLVAGKIVSVEARHASAIRDLISPKSANFAGDDIIDANGLDPALRPKAVLTVANTYLNITLTANNYV